MKTRAILTALAVSSLALTFSCSEDSVTDTGPGYSRSSPNEVLLAFARALEQGDIDVYAECLSADYKYEFLPEDCQRAGVPQKLPFWERDQDIAAMDSLFGDPSAKVREAEFPVAGRWADGPDSLMRCDPFFFRFCFQQDGGNDTTLYVRYSWLDFHFIRDEADTNLWQIAGIKEELKDPWLAGAAAATPYSSFGQIKAMFRHLQACEISPRSTPERLIGNFAMALERMEINTYAECLADEYLFEFDAWDWYEAGVTPDEPWWGKTEDVTSMQRLFESPEVLEIICDLAIAGGPWPGEDDTILYRLDPYMRFVVDLGGENPEYYAVYMSWLDIEIMEDPYEPELWVFKEMVESTKSSLRSGSPPGQDPLTEPHTFGSVKAMFK